MTFYAPPPQTTRKMDSIDYALAAALAMSDLRTQTCCHAGCYEVFELPPGEQPKPFTYCSTDCALAALQDRRAEQKRAERRKMPEPDRSQEAATIRLQNPATTETQSSSNADRNHTRQHRRWKKAKKALRRVTPRHTDRNAVVNTVSAKIELEELLDRFTPPQLLAVLAIYDLGLSQQELATLSNSTRHAIRRALLQAQLKALIPDQ